MKSDLKNAVLWDVCQLLMPVFTRGLLYLEDGGDTFLLNVGYHRTHMRPHSQKMAFFIVTTVKTSNFTNLICFILATQCYNIILKHLLNTLYINIWLSLTACSSAHRLQPG
jgi:hypothetical protein